MRIIKCSSNNHFYPNISLSKYIYILIYNHAMYIIIVSRESRMIDKMVHPFARLPHQVRKCSMVWNIDGNGGHFGAVSTPVSRFSIGWSRGMLRERERESESERVRERASEGRGRMKRREVCFRGRAWFRRATRWSLKSALGAHPVHAPRGILSETSSISSHVRTCVNRVKLLLLRFALGGNFFFFSFFEEEEN